MNRKEIGYLMNWREVRHFLFTTVWLIKEIIRPSRKLTLELVKVCYQPIWKRQLKVEGDNGIIFCPKCGVDMGGDRMSRICDGGHEVGYENTWVSSSIWQCNMCGELFKLLDDD